MLNQLLPSNKHGMALVATVCAISGIRFDFKSKIALPFSPIIVLSGSVFIFLQCEIKLDPILGFLHAKPAVMQFENILYYRQSQTGAS
jgi:hypothetical protein